MDELKMLEEFRRNDKAFWRYYERLQEKYPNKCVAIKYEKVIGADKNPKRLIKRLQKKKEDLATCLIQFVPEKGVQVLY
jgi:hypothetical protein